MKNVLYAALLLISIGVLATCVYSILNDFEEFVSTPDLSALLAFDNVIFKFIGAIISLAFLILSVVLLLNDRVVKSESNTPRK